MQLKHLDETPEFTGEPEQQLKQIQKYLFNLRDVIEEDLRIIADEGLTDEEKREIRKLIG